LIYQVVRLVNCFSDHNMFKLAALVVVVALLNLLGSAHANIIGIDFASDSIKVAIVQPGTPLEIGKQDDV
jgi:hypothetical protein